MHRCRYFAVSLAVMILNLLLPIDLPTPIIYTTVYPVYPRMSTPKPIFLEHYHFGPTHRLLDAFSFSTFPQN